MTGRCQTPPLPLASPISRRRNVREDPATQEYSAQRSPAVEDYEARCEASDADFAARCPEVERGPTVNERRAMRDEYDRSRGF